MERSRIGAKLKSVKRNPRREFHPVGAVWGKHCCLYEIEKKCLTKFTRMKSVNFKNTSDEHLFSLLRDDNKLAMDELFNRYWERLFKSADKLLFDEDAAKDVVQNVFVKIWENRNSILITNLYAYLLQATKYQVISHLRRGKFTAQHEEKLEFLTPENSTEQLINFKELNQAIVESLEHVPTRCREIFYLSRFECLSNKEIADRLDLSVRTVETQISKALKYLRETLETSGIVLLLFLFL